MVEAMSLHMSEEEHLRKQKQDLEMANRQLAAEKELSQQLAQNKIQQSQKQKKHITELESKVLALEQSLTIMVREFEKEKEYVERKHNNELLTTRAEITTLTRQCQLQKRFAQFIAIIIIIMIIACNMTCTQSLYIALHATNPLY